MPVCRECPCFNNCFAPAEEPPDPCLLYILRFYGRPGNCPVGCGQHGKQRNDGGMGVSHSPWHPDIYINSSGYFFNGVIRRMHFDNSYYSTRIPRSETG